MEAAKSENILHTWFYLLLIVLSLNMFLSCKSKHDIISGNNGSYRFYNFDWEDHPNQFKDVGNPIYYEIHIAKDRSFKTILDKDTIALSRYVHDRPFVPGSYYWRTRSFSNKGNVSKWSETKYFKIDLPQEIVTVPYTEGAKDLTDVVTTSVKEVERLSKSGKTVKLFFPSGNYYFGDELTGSIIKLNKLSNIEIEGAGAIIHFSSKKQGLIEATDCSNISISGFDVTYEKNIFRVQGYIKETNAATRTVIVTLDEGSPDFSASENIEQDVFILLDDNVDGRLKDQASSYYRMKDFVDNGNHTYTIHLTNDGDFTDWEVGGRFVYHFRSGSALFVNFPQSTNMTAYNITTDGWGGMGFVSVMGSNFNILHCKTNIKERNWMMGNADGIHIREHVIGPWIEGAKIEGLGDDGLALYARPASIVAAKPQGHTNSAICDDLYFNFEEGDNVTFFEPTKGKILLETKVIRVKKQDDGNYWVDFSDELPDVAITDETLSIGMGYHPNTGESTSGNAFPNIGKLQDRTQIWNRSKSCGDFVVRDSEFLNIRRYGNVFRSRRGVIENNIYEGCSTSAIKCLNETAWPNGLYASEIIIRNNLIDNCGFDGNGTQAVVSFVFNRRGGGTVLSLGSRNLLIEGNTIISSPSPVVELQSARNVVIRNNRTKTGTNEFSAIRYNAVNSENIQFSEK